MGEKAKLVRMNTGVGAYKEAYLVGVDALQELDNDRDEIMAALCDLTARLRVECMGRAIQKSDSGRDYEALETLLRKTNELTGQDMYGNFKAK